MNLQCYVQPASGSPVIDDGGHSVAELAEWEDISGEEKAQAALDEILMRLRP